MRLIKHVPNNDIQLTSKVSSSSTEFSKQVAFSVGVVMEGLPNRPKNDDLTLLVTCARVTKIIIIIIIIINHYLLDCCLGVLDSSTESERDEVSSELLVSAPELFLSLETGPSIGRSGGFFVE